MKCVNCGSRMTTARENAPYTALPGTVLVGVHVSRCASCGEHEVAIPAIEALDRALTHAVIHKPGRLTGPEIRFLRSHLGYTGAEMAKLIGSDPASISRWESGKQALRLEVDPDAASVITTLGRSPAASGGPRHARTLAATRGSRAAGHLAGPISRSSPPRSL